MYQRKITTILFLFYLFFGISAFSQTTAKAEVEKARKTIQEVGKSYNWELFDTTSTLSIDNIKSENLQGLWKAYNGLFKFGSMVNSMSLTQPMTIEIKEDGERRSQDSKFEKYTLNANQIVSQKANDFGVINKITEKLLVITWKNGDNYTRYYYEK